MVSECQISRQLYHIGLHLHGGFLNQNYQMTKIWSGFVLSSSVGIRLFDRYDDENKN